MTTTENYSNIPKSAIIQIARKVSFQSENEVMLRGLQSQNNLIDRDIREAANIYLEKVLRECDLLVRVAGRREIQPHHVIGALRIRGRSIYGGTLNPNVSSTSTLTSTSKRKKKLQKNIKE